MRKKDLIQGEVYKHYNGNLIKFQEYSSKTTIIGEYLGDNCNFYMSYYNSPFTILDLKLASPKEKHWLEECIRLNKYIEKEEALKTFKQELTELPKKWCIYTESGSIVHKWFNKTLNRNIIVGNLKNYLHYPEIDINICSSNEIIENYIEISLEDFEKLVLKKQTINKSKFISETEVESADDGYFKVGDKVSIINSKNPVFRNKKYFTIKSFRWNNPKTEICAVLNNNFPNGIGIDKLQIYVEPKLKNEFISLKQAVKIKNNNFNNETLLEKAKRLYPIGTKIKSTIGTIGIIQTNNYRNGLKLEDYYYADDGKLELYNFRLNIWAEIIEYPHGFKIGNLIQLLKSEQKLQHVITKIEGNELFYNFNNKEFKILAKNAVKVK